MQRLAFCLVAGIALLAACSPARPPIASAPAIVEGGATAAPSVSQGAIPNETPSSQAPAVKRSTDIARLGQLSDPLPKPLSIASSTVDAPKFLAKRVMSGGDDALPALMAALQASGVAVVGPNEELVLRPGEPWSGLIVESWEVRLLLASVLPERTVTMTLPQLSDALRAVPEMNGPAIDRYLVDDIRAMAKGTPSPKQFWARFIVELGRDPAAIDENDLLAARDLTELRLNGLQTSLILRRLSLDMLMVGGSPTRSGGMPHVAMSVPAAPLADDVPCTMTSTQKTILDIAAFATKTAVNGFKVFDLGFGGLLGYLDKIGLENSGTSAVGKFKDGRSIAGALLTYAKFIATYASLEVNVEMEAAPLTRTKQTRPASGETKELTATVRLNTGNAQVVNCFRVMLNALGLDFKLTQNGPVKNAHIGWQGDSGFSELVASRGGPDQIVRFVGSGSDGEFKSENSITNAATNADGKTTVKVEGVGQRIKKPQNAVKVIKHASVHVNVALKGADMFGDLADAAGNATGGAKALIGLPADILYRSQWASEGHYSFDVVDWSGTQWSGTLSMTKTETSRKDLAGRVSQATTIDEVKMTITAATQYQSIGDDSIADMTGTVDGRYEQTATDTLNWTVQSDSKLCAGLTFSGTDLETHSAKASGSGDANIRVQASGLQYEISAAPADNVEDMVMTGQVVKQGHAFRQAGNGCANVVVDKTTQTSPITGTHPLLGFDIKGQADPDDVDRLAGSTTTTQDIGGGTITIKLTWDLRRD